MDGGNVFEASKFGGLCGQLMLVVFFFSNLYKEHLTMQRQSFPRDNKMSSVNK